MQFLTIGEFNSARFFGLVLYSHGSNLLDPVYTVPDPHDHDIKLNSSTTSVALTLTIVLQNLTTSSHRKIGESKYDRKLPELSMS